MADTPSTVVDTVPYASPDDVLKYIRNRDSYTDPGESEAISMLLDRSDFVDDRTNRAWRRREVTDYDARVRLSHLQKHQRHRRRSRRRSGRRLRDPTSLPDPYAPVQLPYLNVVEISNLELISGEDYEDITSNGTLDVTSDADLEDSLWYGQPSRGRLQIDLAALTVGPNTRRGRVVDNSNAVVTFQYGRDESAAATEASNGNISGTTDPNSSTSGVSESVPDSLREATAQLVAADIARMDDLGDMFRSSGEDLDLQGAADSLQEDAMEAINEWRRVP
jgi:hypothetical protein